MTALGPYADGFAAWRRMLGAVQQAEDQREVFGNAVVEVAGYVARGLDRAAAADELADMAASIGFDDADAVQAEIAAAFAKADGPDRVPDDWTNLEQAHAGNGGTASAPHYARRYAMMDQTLIPKRAWLYGGHYIRQTVSATVAPGGWGKTTLQLYEALEMVAAGVRVWYLSGEDPLVELDRRIAAHCQLHQLRLDDCPGQLFVDDRSSFPLSVATVSRRGDLEFNDADLRLLEAAIVHDAIDVVILDPFIGFHGVAENDNSSIDKVVKRLVAVAIRSNCAIEISHHVRKATAGAGLRLAVTVDDARGGSAIIDAVRSARVLNRMSQTEAELAKVKDNKKNFYVRVDIGKRNMAPPPEKATWYRLCSVELANGDQVQALRLWEFPTVFDGVAVADTDYIRELVHLRPYRADSRSDDWLGLAVAKRLHLDVTNRSDIIKIQRLIGVWLNNGVFVKKEIKDGQRRPRMFYVAPTRPDNVVPFAPRDDDDDNT